MAAIYDGVLMGILLSVLIGPVFFLLLETSVTKGIKAALAMDIGVILSDLLYLILALSLTNELKASLESGSEEILHLCGGLIFISFGGYNLLVKGRSKKIKKIEINRDEKNYLVLFLKGFFLNGFNPSVLIYWIGIVVLSSEKYPDKFNQYSFLITILSVYFLLDILKLLGASKLKKIITSNILIRLNQFTGIIFTIFGILLIIRSMKG